MNILSISSLFPYPDLPHHGVFVKNRLKALSEISGNKVSVFCPVAYSFLHTFFDRYRAQCSAVNSKEQFGEALSVFYPGYFSVPGCLKSIEKTSSLFSVFRYIENHIDVSSIDVIDVHWGYPDLLIGAKLAKKYNKPLSFTLRGMETFYLGDGRGADIRATMSQVDGVISLSHEMAKHVKEMAPGLPTFIVQNGADPDVFFYVEKEVARSALKLDFSGRFFLATGSIIERKGFQYLISAMRGMPNDVHLVIAGKPGLEGNYFDTLRNLLASHGLSSRVHFVGAKSHAELRLYYAAAEAFCLSSLGEGSPNVLMEAAMCGCPLIAHNVGESRFVVEQSLSGVLLGDPNITRHEDVVSSWEKAMLDHITKPRELGLRKEQSALFCKMDWRWCAARTNEALKYIILKGY